MNLPNRLTLLRVILVPVFAVFVLYPQIPCHYLWAFLVFAAASLTDHYDGKIARSRNLVTNFGKFLDPLADKALVISALVCFLSLGLADVWCVLIIIARELTVTSLRLLALEEGGKVIAANRWGKVKTASQMTAVLLILASQSALEILKIAPTPAPVQTAGSVLIWIAAALTLLSGVIYLKENAHLFRAAK
jgi:CDP-diacylglycerol--glycerol-3-phosphate 3-phosphatidyltransferase